MILPKIIFILCNFLSREHKWHILYIFRCQFQTYGWYFLDASSLWHENNKFRPCTLWFLTPNRLTFFLVDAIKIWQWNMNLYNLYKNLPYSDFDCSHKATGNMPLKLRHFLNFSDFSLFCCIKLSISMSFGKRNCLGCFKGKIIALI